MQLSPLVPEEELAAAWVQLQVVDLAVVVHRGLDLVESQVLDADRQVVQEVGDDLGGLAASQLLLRVVEAGRDHVGAHVLRSAGADDLVDAVLDDGQLACVEDHADVGVREVELLVAAASPRELGELAQLKVAEKESALSRGDKVTVLVDVDLRNLVALGRLEDQALAAVDPLDDDLRK